MALVLTDIGVGTTEGDDTGDKARVGGLAINANNALIETAINEADYNHQTGTTYTIQASDTGKIITFDNAASIAVTLPDTLDTNFQCTIIQIGAGVPTVTPGTDTINGAGTGVAPAAQWKAMYLSQFADTEWLAIL